MLVFYIVCKNRTNQDQLVKQFTLKYKEKNLNTLPSDLTEWDTSISIQNVLCSLRRNSVSDESEEQIERFDSYVSHLQYGDK